MLPWFRPPHTLVYRRGNSLRTRQLPVPLRRAAVSTHLIKSGAANGLARKPMAPALNARSRTLSSGKAVIKTNGALWPWACKCVRRSNPLMPGICTSATTHDELCKWVDRRNSSADANVWTTYPCELRRLSIAARTDASSSMTEISESIDKTTFLMRAQGACLEHCANRKVSRKSGLGNHT
jgi:hypothetical protein